MALERLAVVWGVIALAGLAAAEPIVYGFGTLSEGESVSTNDPDLVHSALGTTETCLEYVREDVTVRVAFQPSADSDVVDVQVAFADGTQSVTLTGESAEAELVGDAGSSCTPTTVLTGTRLADEVYYLVCEGRCPIGLVL